ncbi:MAG TPA: universal stress protein [Gemmataceae bacterium]|nr:universal stress protein [Gemmataceae bacterium]
MFNKLLVPIDLTEKHQAVVKTAAELALQNGGTVTLLHVIEAITGLSQEEEKRFYHQLQQAAEKHLQKYAERLAEHKVSCQQRVLIGNRVREMVAFAGEMNADLILLTAPRFDPAKPMSGWGSMSYRVSVLAECPVLLVKN